MQAQSRHLQRRAANQAPCGARWSSKHRPALSARLPGAQKRAPGLAAAGTSVVQTAPATTTVEFVGVLDGMQTVKGVLDVGVAPQQAWTALTDYAACNRVFANIAATRELPQPDGSLQLLQDCSWRFLGFKGTFEVQLAVTEDAAARVLVFRLVRSGFLRDFEGRWQVMASPVVEGGCRIEHVLSVKPLMPIPGAVAGYLQPIFTSQVTGIMQDLERATATETGATAAEAVIQPYVQVEPEAMATAHVTATVMLEDGAAIKGGGRAASADTTRSVTTATRETAAPKSGAADGRVAYVLVRERRHFVCPGELITLK